MPRLRLDREPVRRRVRDLLALIAVAVALIVVILISFLPGSWPVLFPWVDLSGPLPTN